VVGKQVGAVRIGSTSGVPTQKVEKGNKE
jgi:hypothetical protein